MLVLWKKYDWGVFSWLFWPQIHTPFLADRLQGELLTVWAGVGVSGNAQRLKYCCQGCGCSFTIVGMLERTLNWSSQLSLYKWVPLHKLLAMYSVFEASAPCFLLDKKQHTGYIIPSILIFSADLFLFLLPRDSRLDLALPGTEVRINTCNMLNIVLHGSNMSFWLLQPVSICYYQENRSILSVLWRVFRGWYV